MRLLKYVPIEDDGTTKENVNLVCYHPVQVKYLLRGENVDPKCCATDYEYESILQPIFEIFGWQGGTIHQIIDEIKRLKEEQSK